MNGRRENKYPLQFLMVAEGLSLGQPETQGFGYHIIFEPDRNVRPTKKSGSADILVCGNLDN